MTLALRHNHKPFELAGTARGLRALDLVGALLALWRAKSGGRKKRFDQDRRKIHDSQHAQACSEAPERIGMDTKISQRGVARDGTCPATIASSSRRSGGGPKMPKSPYSGVGTNWRRQAVATREANPDWPTGPSAHTPADRGPWGFGEGVVSSDRQPASWPLCTRAPPSPHGTWVNALGKGAASDALSNLPGIQNRPVSAPRANSPRAQRKGHAAEVDFSNIRPVMQ